MLYFPSELEQAYFNVIRTKEKARQRFYINKDSKLKREEEGNL
jgi:hypothetical protein